MTPELIKALNSVDKATLSAAVRMLTESTNSASDEDIEELHKAGVIPTGIRNYIIALRVNV